MGKLFKYCIAAAFLITTCYYVNNRKQESIEASNFYSVERNTNNIESSTSASMDIIEADFNLGEKSFVTDLGNRVYYNVRGLISVPKEEDKYPLVLIVHGRYNNSSNDTRFDKGFKYLVNYLASCGYAVATLDIQGAYNSNFGNEDDNKKVRAMFPSFIEAFKNANNGILDGFNVDLTGMIDLENIALIGHSRGGETVVDIALENEAVKSVISIAPTLPDELNRKYPDVPISIIVPELDGDVDGLDGFSLFDSIMLDENRTSSLDLVLLKNANHNWFNSMLIKNDALMLEDDEKIKNQITREEQENFLKEFSKDFLDSIFKDKTEGTLYDYSISEPGSMYGLEVKTQIWRKKQNIILDYNNYSETTYEGVEVTILKEAISYEDDEIEGFVLPLQNVTGFDYKNLINIKWRNRLGKVEIPIDNINLKKYNTLALNLAIDSSDELNTKNEGQTFTVRLEDSKGNISEVILGKDSTSLDYVEGGIIYTPYLETMKPLWSSYTVLSDIRIPLEVFKGVNLKKIIKITLVFNKNDSGSIMVNNIRLL